MNKYELVKTIEKIAPLDTQEKWDCSGWGVNNSIDDVKKVMCCLTITPNVYNQAKKQNCDLIIAHHPLFKVPVYYSDINMYSAHTNLDKAQGGTTDTLIKKLGFQGKVYNEFVRIVGNINITVEELASKLTKISPDLRYVNNANKEVIHSIGFCAGSGSEFIEETPTDAFITGDLKFHTALDSNKIVFDIGHFESEILIVEEIKKILVNSGFNNVIIAQEQSPFKYLSREIN